MDQNERGAMAAELKTAKELQKKFFKVRLPSVLEESKKVEREFDKALAIAKPGQTGQLFTE